MRPARPDTYITIAAAAICFALSLLAAAAAAARRYQRGGLATYAKSLETLGMSQGNEIVELRELFAVEAAAREVARESLHELEATHQELIASVTAETPETRKERTSAAASDENEPLRERSAASEGMGKASGQAKSDPPADGD